MKHSILTSLAALALPCLALAAPQVDDFEGGINTAGWTFNSFSPDVLESTGGDPGWWLHNSGLDAFAPIVTTTGPGAGFEGDYQALGVTGLSVDAQTVSSNFPVNGFEFSLLLRDTKGTSTPDDDDYTYYVGPEIPLPGAGWKSFFFPIPSSTAAGTPAGWSGGWVGDCCSFRPGVTWQDVIQNVDQVEVWWLNPSFFAIFQQWNVGVDNVHLHFDGSTTVRNGGGTNPVGFASVNTPLVGAAWDTTVDIASPGASASIVSVGASAATSGTILNVNLNGEVLILPPFFVTDVSLTGAHSLAVPLDYSLSGSTVYAQAATFVPGNVVLNNAIDVTFGAL